MSNARASEHQRSMPQTLSMQQGAKSGLTENTGTTQMAVSFGG